MKRFARFRQLAGFQTLGSLLQLIHLIEGFRRDLTILGQCFYVWPFFEGRIKQLQRFRILSLQRRLLGLLVQRQHFIVHCAFLVVIVRQ
ncbi:hypothetical protein D1872_329540 [compost metagenome]